MPHVLGYDEALSSEAAAAVTRREMLERRAIMK
jgi:hypothetical protein